MENKTDKSKGNFRSAEKKTQLIYVGEKMKIGVFKLNWIAQRDLKFEMRKEHSGKKKRVDRCQQARECSRHMDTPTET